MLTGAPAAGSFQPIDFAASIARLNASTEPISVLGAPLRTNRPTPVFARSVLLSGTTLPCFSRASICGPDAMTTSAASPFLNTIGHATDCHIVEGHLVPHRLLE